MKRSGEEKKNSRDLTSSRPQKELTAKPHAPEAAALPAKLSHLERSWSADVFLALLVPLPCQAFTSAPQCTPDTPFQLTFDLYSFTHMPYKPENEMPKLMSEAVRGIASTWM